MEFEAQSEPNLRKEEGEDEGEDGKNARNPIPKKAKREFTLQTRPENLANATLNCPKRPAKKENNADGGRGSRPDSCETEARTAYAKGIMHTQKHTDRHHKIITQRQSGGTVHTRFKGRRLMHLSCRTHKDSLTKRHARSWTPFDVAQKNGHLMSPTRTRRPLQRGNGKGQLQRGNWLM